MELIEGVPIDRYCSESGSGMREVLKLFLDVCAAVSHAHRNLVVHRDLKPGNVLVTRDGTPKVLDFGVVKLLAPDASDVTTHPGWIAPLTLRYASPEQWIGGPISTASDVYSLGVLLSELLESDDGKRPRDLDLILRQATRPEPERRYPSVEAFADDLERFLAGEPVARAPALVPLPLLPLPAAAPSELRGRRGLLRAAPGRPGIPARSVAPSPARGGRRLARPRAGPLRLELSSTSSSTLPIPRSWPRIPDSSGSWIAPRRPSGTSWLPTRRPKAVCASRSRGSTHGSDVRRMPWCKPRGRSSSLDRRSGSASGTGRP